VVVVAVAVVVVVWCVVVVVCCWLKKGACRLSIAAIKVVLDQGLHVFPP
jgi:hypothetical protein